MIDLLILFALFVGALVISLWGDSYTEFDEYEDDDFEHLKRGRDSALAGSAAHALASSFVSIPDAKANLHFWGLGGTVDIKIGTALASSRCRTEPSPRGRILFRCRSRRLQELQDP